MTPPLLVLVVWVILALGAHAGGAQTPASGNLAAAKALYASGDYEGALTDLASASPGDSLDEVDEYRALCLLALGRTAEVQRSLETLVTRNPLFKMSESDVSPRLVALFHEVRRRLLPGAVRDLYARAKSDFEQGNYDTAKPQLEELMTLLSDDDLAEDSASLSDLKMLADGFLKLANAQIAAKASAAASAPKAVATPTPTPGARVSEEAPARNPAPDRVYSVEDKDVTPPVDVNCPLPAWNPSNPSQMHEFRGVLRVVIDAQGKVETASVVVPAHPAYDPLLAAAAKLWQYRPALRNGQPVKYQKMIPITLRPRVEATPAS